MPQFHKLENCLLRNNAFFALKGQIWRTMELGPMDGVITLASHKQSYRSLRNLKMYPGLVFRPPGQICYVSLKGFSRRGTWSLSKELNELLINDVVMERKLYV